MSFASDLRAFSRNTGIRADRVVRKVVIDMTSDIVRATPVDTGHARSNWFWGVNASQETTTAEHKGGAPSLVRAGEFAATAKAGGVCYLSNNLPYIMRLEFGYSQQAPAGMARITVSRWQQIVNAAVAS